MKLNTGAAQGADQGRVRTHPVRVDQGRVLIDAALDRPKRRTPRQDQEMRGRQ